MAGGIVGYIAKLDTKEEREKADYRSPLTYFIATLMLGGINILLLFPALNRALHTVAIFWNLAVIFILISYAGQLRFSGGGNGSE